MRSIAMIPVPDLGQRGLRYERVGSAYQDNLQQDEDCCLVPDAAAVVHDVHLLLALHQVHGAYAHVSLAIEDQQH